MSNAQPCPACPRCRTNRGATRRHDGLYQCGVCRGLYDDDPNEGGTYHHRDPSRRLEREEEYRILNPRRGR